jgi:hypothetical protein
MLQQILEKEFPVEIKNESPKIQVQHNNEEPNYQ